MDLLFNARPPMRGIIEFGRFRVLREMLKQNLAKAIGYYRQGRIWVDSDHPIVTLLGAIEAPLSLDADVYNSRVSEQAFEIAKILKYTSPVSTGTVRDKSMLYGAGTCEAAMISIDRYDNLNIAQNWRDLTPIRVLRHPRSDLLLWPLNGEYASKEEGTACLDINLPMLASQYRMWMKTEALLLDGNVDLPAVFLSRYALNNAMASHFDLAFFNRLCRIYANQPLPEPEIRSPFYQIDYTDKVDDILRKELQVLADKRPTFEAIMTQLPAITVDNLAHLYRSPNQGLFTHYVHWFTTLYRLPLMAFLVQENARNNNPANSQHLKVLRRFFLSTGNDRTMLDMMPPRFRSMVSDEIKFGVLPYLEITNNF